MLDAADLCCFARERRDVITRDVLRSELAAAGHQLAQPLGEALVIGVEPQGSGRQAAVFVVILIMIVILFGGGSYEIAIYD